MTFSQEYLTDLVNGKAHWEPVQISGRRQTDGYLKQVVGRIKDLPTLEVKADFDHYGSGYASYVHLYLSRRDKKDVQVSTQGDLRSEHTSGLMMYLCRLAPFAVFGAGDWSTTTRNGEFHSAGSHYIEPDEVGSLPFLDWSSELREISDLLHQFGITILTHEEVIPDLTFKISIPTILSDPPYRVFDCFFYWED